MGIGMGYSVCEVVDMVKWVFDSDFCVEFCFCCVGDFVKLVVDVCCVKELFGWEVMCSDFEIIVKDVWWFFSVKSVS